MLRYQVRGENLEITQAIREYVESKVSKLEKYFADSLEANVYANAKVYKNNKKKIEITVPLKGVTLRAEETNEDLYAAVDLVVDKLERQMRKHKTRINSSVKIFVCFLCAKCNTFKRDSYFNFFLIIFVYFSISVNVCF